MFKQKLNAGLIGAVLMLGLTLSTPPAMAFNSVTEAEMPEVVVKTFKMAYPNAGMVKWKHKKVHMGKLKGLELYEVEFEDENGIDHEILYGADGRLYKGKMD